MFLLNNLGHKDLHGTPKEFRLRIAKQTFGRCIQVMDVSNPVDQKHGDGRLPNSVGTSAFGISLLKTLT